MGCLWSFGRGRGDSGGDEDVAVAGQQRPQPGHGQARAGYGAIGGASPRFAAAPASAPARIGEQRADAHAGGETKQRRRSDPIAIPGNRRRRTDHYAHGGGGADHYGGDPDAELLTANSALTREKIPAGEEFYILFDGEVVTI
jgi:hypothetical protein